MSITVNCRLLVDGTEKEPKENCAIEINDGKIIGIKSTFNSNPEDKIIDWSHYVVIPGMFDCHDHITEDLGMEYYCEEERKIVSALRAAKNCSKILKSGITTVRDGGAKYAVNIKVRDAIKRNLIEGPDIIAPGNRISRTGYPKYEICKEADGIDEIRKTIREEQKNGADFIKLMITGAGAGDPIQSEYSKEEIKAGIEEAHNLGLKVGVHAHGGQAATCAIENRVDVIEHGTYLEDSDFETMKKNNTSLVITLPVLHYFKDLNNLPSLSDNKVQGKYSLFYLDLLKTIKKAIEYNLLFSVGGDNHHGDPAGNIKVLTDCGISPSKAIRILTRDSARICSLGNIKGTIEPGKIADMVALEGSPLDYIEDFRRISGIIKTGILRWSKDNVPG